MKFVNRLWKKRKIDCDKQLKLRDYIGWEKRYTLYIIEQVRVGRLTYANGDKITMEDVGEILSWDG